MLARATDYITVATVLLVFHKKFMYIHIIHFILGGAPVSTDVLRS